MRRWSHWPALCGACDNTLRTEPRSAKKHYTWHQVDDFDAKSGNTTMQLVRKSAYEATYPHGGSVAQYEKHFKIKGRTCLNKSATLHS
ncbi:HNH endonuclease [Pseudomonas veronii]|uniref:HNH endonuclease n=1 Tax=Pseudomonas veronii TaxID=76761 RepID=UPI00190087DC